MYVDHVGHAHYDEERIAEFGLKEEEKKEEKERNYDVYTYFISNLDTYLGKAIVASIRKD